MELDIVAESLDQEHVLVGEAKWSGQAGDVQRWGAQLRAKAAAAPFVRDRRILHALWLRQLPPTGGGMDAIVTPELVLAALK